MLEYKLEPLTPSVIKEMAEHQDKYWQETEAHYRKFPLKMKWHIFLKAQDIGALRMVTIREDAFLKGMGLLVITEDPICDCILASIALIYVVPEYRKGRVGIELAKTLLDEARMSGAQLITAQTCLHNNVHRIFEYLGFTDYGRLLIREVR
jgi:GNAT superfamily N-acetyltransferase